MSGSLPDNIDIEALIAEAYQRGLSDAQKTKESVKEVEETLQIPSNSVKTATDEPSSSMKTAITTTTTTTTATSTQISSPIRPRPAGTSSEEEESEESVDDNDHDEDIAMKSTSKKSTTTSIKRQRRSATTTLSDEEEQIQTGRSSSQTTSTTAATPIPTTPVLNKRSSLRGPGTPTRFVFEERSAERRSIGGGVNNNDNNNNNAQFNLTPTKNQDDLDREQRQLLLNQTPTTGTTPTTGRRTLMGTPNAKRFTITAKTPTKPLVISSSPKKTPSPVTKNRKDNNSSMGDDQSEEESEEYDDNDMINEKKSTIVEDSPNHRGSVNNNNNPSPSLFELQRSPQLQHIGVNLHPKSPSVIRFNANQGKALTPTLDNGNAPKTTPKNAKKTKKGSKSSKMGENDSSEEESDVSDEDNSDSDDDENVFTLAEDEEFLSSLDWVTRQPINPLQPTQTQYKILVLGNASCGKSSIVQRYTKGTFSKEYKTTIGADYSRKLLKMKNNEQIGLQLFDIAGQERFNSQGLSRSFTRHARAAVVVFDISRPETFDAVREWKKQLDFHFFIDDDNSDGNAVNQTQSNLPTMFPLILLMNKCDLLNRNVNELLSMGAKLEKLKNELGFTAAFTTSAKDCVYIAETFDFLADLLYKQDIARKTEYYKKFHPEKLKIDPITKQVTILEDQNENNNFAVNEEDAKINKIIAEAHADPRTRNDFYRQGQVLTNRAKRVDITKASNNGGGGCC